MTEVKLPSIAEGVESATITFWHVKKGDKVKEGQDLVEIATDKATFNLPSPASGSVSEICFNEGDQVNVGTILAKLE